MAVVNAGEWMEEPLLKASIDPLPAPEESKGLDMAQGFPGRHRGADVQVPLNKGIVLPLNVTLTDSTAPLQSSLI